jgi:Domain of unknown function (DUF5076)
MTDDPAYRFKIEELGLDLSQADEVVRIFMGREEGNTILINAQALREPFILGMLCVDLMKHGAMAFAQAQGMDPQQAFQGILAGLTAELQNPTDESGEPN